MTRFLFAVLLPGASEHLLGDLEEEAQTKSKFWLLRQVTEAAAYNSNLLETAAATAFLLGLPLLLTLELRRFALTLIPFRESAEFSFSALLFTALAIAALAAWETRLLGGRWLPVILATLLTAAIAALTNLPAILTAAAFVGGLLATLRRQGDIA